MSCAHTFETWCPECVDGLIAAHNLLNQKHARLTEQRDAARFEQALAVSNYRAAVLERDRFKDEMHRQMALKNDYLKAVDEWAERTTTAEAEVAQLTEQRDVLRVLVESAEEYLSGTLGTCEPDCDCLLHNLRAALAMDAPKGQL